MMIMQAQNFNNPTRQTMPTFRKPLPIPSLEIEKGSSTSLDKDKIVYHKHRAKKMTFADNMTASSKATTTTNEKSK